MFRNDPGTLLCERLRTQHCLGLTSLAACVADVADDVAVRGVQPADPGGVEVIALHVHMLEHLLEVDGVEGRYGPRQSELVASAIWRRVSWPDATMLVNGGVQLRPDHHDPADEDERKQ